MTVILLFFLPAYKIRRMTGTVCSEKAAYCTMGWLLPASVACFINIVSSYWSQVLTLYILGTALKRLICVSARYWRHWGQKPSHWAQDYSGINVGKIMCYSKWVKMYLRLIMGILIFARIHLLSEENPSVVGMTLVRAQVKGERRFCNILEEDTFIVCKLCVHVTRKHLLSLKASRRSRVAAGRLLAETSSKMCGSSARHGSDAVKQKKKKLHCLRERL